MSFMVLLFSHLVIDQQSFVKTHPGQCRPNDEKIQSVKKVAPILSEPQAYILQTISQIMMLVHMRYNQHYH